MVALCASTMVGLLGMDLRLTASAKKRCACAVGKQAPSDLNSALSLVAGNSISLSTPAGSSDGAWVADFGTIDGATYTVPNFVPPTGFDFVRYVSSTGTVTVHLHVDENPDGSTPAIPKVVFNLADKDSDSWQDDDYMASLRSAVANQTGPFVVVPSDYVAEPREVANCVAAPTNPDGSISVKGYDENNGPVSIAASPAMAESTANAQPSRNGTQTSSAQLQQYSPQACTITPPGHQPPYGPCNGPTQVNGRISYAGPVSSPEDEGSETLTATNDNKVALGKLLNIAITIGSTYTVKFTAVADKTTATYYIDFYTCVNGSYVFDHTDFCRQTSVHRYYTNTWAAKIGPKLIDTPWTPSYPTCCNHA